MSEQRVTFLETNKELTDSDKNVKRQRKRSKSLPNAEVEKTSKILWGSSCNVDTGNYKKPLISLTCKGSRWTKLRHSLGFVLRIQETRKLRKCCMKIQGKTGDSKSYLFLGWC